MRSYGDDTHYSDSEKFMNGIVKPSKRYDSEPVPSYEPKYSKSKHLYEPKYSKSKPIYKHEYSKSKSSYKPKSSYSRGSMLIRCPNCGKYYKNRYCSCPYCNNSKNKSSYMPKINTNSNKPYMKFDDPNFKPNWSCAPNVSKSSSSKDSDTNIDWETSLIVIIMFILIVLWFLVMFGDIMFR